MPRTDFITQRICLKEGRTLRERLVAPEAAQDARQITTHNEHTPTPPRSWIHALGPSEPANFERRLRWAGVNRKTVDAIFSGRDIPAPSTPTWAPLLTGLRKAIQTSAGRPLRPQQATIKTSWSDSTAQDHPFVDLWDPVVSWAAQKLRGSLDHRVHNRIHTRAIDDLGHSLLARLCHVSEQALWDQFNRARAPGTMFLAHLGLDKQGQSAPTRDLYEAFILQQRRSGAEQLFAEFPVLGRLLAQVIELWHEASREMLQRIVTDRPSLESVYGIAVDANLTGIKQGMSEPHRGGRTVAILKFSKTNQQWKVVYKPKDIGVDAMYQSALSDLNAHSGLSPLRILIILQKNNYGYMEYVEHRLCTDEEELERFYRNAGRLTGVLHVLGCTDCHYENLIASGDQLVLIDTETLLEVDLPDHVTKSSNHDFAVSDLQRSMKHSVLRSGLLPQWVFVGAAKIATDVSALGIEPPRKAQRAQPGWLGLNSDGMMVGLVSQPAEVPSSLPVGVGASNRLGDYLEVFCNGFREQLEAHIERRDYWLAADGVLSKFRGLRRRILLRSTHVYFSIQQQQLEPPSLRTSVAQGLILEQLARSFLTAEDCPKNWPVFEAELRQMEQLDFPFFEHYIDGRDLLMPDGMALIDEFIQTSGLAVSRKCLEELDQSSIAFQLQLIRSVAQTKQFRADHSPNLTAKAYSDRASSKVSNTRRLEETLRLGRQIQARAVRSQDGRPEWLGMVLGDDAERFSFGMVGMSLYSGNSGIAIFLKALASQLRETGQAVAADSMQLDAMKALLPLQEIAGRNHAGAVLRWWRNQALGMTGTGGILLALQIMQHQSDRGGQWGSYAETIETLLAGLRPERIRSDDQLDVMGGSSGLIGALLNIGNDKALELATVAGERLLTTQDDKSGAWLIGGRFPRPLTGFSHGAAGVAAALAQLHRVTGENRFLKAAERGLTYEHLLFDKEKQNWPDLRHSEANGQFMTSWCHGAPGIALSRLCLRETSLWNNTRKEELDRALQTTSTHSSHIDHICCGSFGLSSILRIASEVTGAQQWREAADRIEASVVARARQNDGNYELLLDPPGMFTGKAGIGLALLRTPMAKTMTKKVISGGLLRHSGKYFV